MAARVAAILADLPDTANYWIAYSGGLDSHVLLSLITTIASGFVRFPAIRAVHVHHGLLAQADGWTHHCEQVCARYGVPLTVIRVDARHAAGESPEETARRARYAAIQTLLAPGDILLTAQHEDDQAETLLLQLLRGAGLPGLAAMPETAEFGPGLIVRPLLHCTRQELRVYAEASQLQWIEDPSNRDCRYDRNYLRQMIMPLLTERWPSAGRALARSASHCSEAQSQLLDLATDLYGSALLPDRSLSASKLRQFKRADQRLVIREWLRHQGFRMPSTHTLDRVLTEAMAAAPDKSPIVAWREGEIRRYRDRLFVMHPKRADLFDPGRVIPWTEASMLILPDGNGRLRAEPGDGPGLDPVSWQAGRREIRYRRGGETCKLPGRVGTRCLKKLFQEHGVPDWVRPRVPLIYVDGRLAAVANFWVCAEFAAETGAPAVAILWDDNGLTTLTD